jgi:hypothetical protein
MSLSGIPVSEDSVQRLVLSQAFLEDEISAGNRGFPEETRKKLTAIRDAEFRNAPVGKSP